MSATNWWLSWGHQKTGVLLPGGDVVLISEEQSLGRVSQYLLGIAYKVLW